MAEVPKDNGDIKKFLNLAEDLEVKSVRASPVNNVDPDEYPNPDD